MTPGMVDEVVGVLVQAREEAEGMREAVRGKRRSRDEETVVREIGRER